MNLSEVFEARRRIRQYIHLTPLRANPLLPGTYFKMECWQITGSFKVRGALNALFTCRNGATRFVTASAGNHGLGVTYAARLLGKKVRIYVPESVVVAKLNMLKSLGAEVVVAGKDYDDAEQIALRASRDHNWPFIHAFAEPAVIAGQGTVGLEIIEAMPEVKQVIVPVGGGGLISGVALAIKTMRPQAEVIGVQPEASPAMYRALQAGKVVECPIGPTSADGLAGRFVHERTLEYTRRYVDRIVLVTEPAIQDAWLWLWREAKIVAEASAVVGLAALLANQIPFKRPCVLILTGSNTSVYPHEISNQKEQA